MIGHKLHLQRTMAECGIPDYMRGGLADYILHGLPPGDFLQAVISNDLKEAVGRADETNQRCLPEYIKFLYNHAPIGCWGGRAEMVDWCKRGGLVGRVDAAEEA